MIRTKAVAEPTTVILLRVRYLLNQPDRPALLSEEVRAIGFRDGKRPKPIDDAEALRLLAEAKPDANIAMPEKHKVIEAALASWPVLEPIIRERVSSRAIMVRSRRKVGSWRS